MSDGQSRCEYDEPEEAAPQERLKGGGPWASILITPLYFASSGMCLSGPWSAYNVLKLLHVLYPVNLLINQTLF